MSVKTTILPDERIKVEGYLVKYSSPDNPDLDGEYWNKSTWFMREAGFPIQGAPIKFQHAMDKSFGNIGIGVLDLVNEDDIGLFVQGQLKNRQDYERMLEEINTRRGLNLSKSEIARKADMAYKAVLQLVNEVPLQFSMGADPSTFKVRKADGLIESAGIIEASLTPTPAEPNGTEVFFKSYPKELIELNANSSLSQSGAIKMDMAKLRELLAAALESALVEAATMMDTEKMEVEDMETAKETMLKEAVEDTEEVVQLQKSLGNDVDYSKLVASIVDQKLGKYVKTYVETAMSKVEARKAAIRDAVKSAMPATPVKAQVGAYQQPAQVRVISNQYDYLDTDTMALAVRLASSAIPYKGAKVRDLVNYGLSEEFINAAAHRIADTIGREQAPSKSDEMAYQDHRARKSAMPIKANELDATDISNQGLEWLSVFYDTRLWERARDKTELFDRLVAKGMRTVTIPQGSKSMNVKLNTGSPTVYTAPEANSVDATGRPEVVSRLQPFTTDQVEVASAKHILATGITYELEQDSIINTAQFLNEDNTRTLAEALESALLNGDTATAANTNINLIDGTPAGGIQAPLYLAWNGIRKQALVTNTAQSLDFGGTLTEEQFNQLRAKFPAAIIARTDQMLFVVDYLTESKMRTLPYFKGKNAIGEDSTIFAGRVDNIFNVDVYMSGLLALSNTAGKISATPGNNIYGTVALVFAPYWQYGRKQAVAFESQNDIMSQTRIVVASVRHAFTARGQYAANVGYKVGV